MHWEASGAFTGEVSPAMVSELCHYVIIGHSERRHVIGEKDELINKKIAAAIQDQPVAVDLDTFGMMR